MGQERRLWLILGSWEKQFLQDEILSPLSDRNPSLHDAPYAIAIIAERRETSHAEGRSSNPEQRLL